MTNLQTVLNTVEVQWLKNNSTTETPYSDIDYTEYAFNGRLPAHMANKIKAAMKAIGWNGYKQDTIGEWVGNKRFDLTLKFGTAKRTQNNVTFFYTEETE